MSYSNIGANLPKQLPQFNIVKLKTFHFANKLKLNMSTPELLLLAKFNELGVKVSTQVVVAGFIVDFAFKDIRLAIELDGAEHKITKDNIRDGALLSYGYHTIHFKNIEVVDNIELVIGEIDLSLKLLKLKKKRTKLLMARTYETPVKKGYFQNYWI